ncbi:PIN domain-containing protein [Saccharolobus caldissimus]|uniref:PIN domain nuclease n=1 Tax=Saccharolobus caldissimus TaxID=1702097 RepID=A0AAQ4CVA4_9CREN|nr:PIN domain-containing protein [Saccharolobus caldissimus]BDB99735.1 PIN domain nuclease [Saccharolobus caldissimus]
MGKKIIVDTYAILAMAYGELTKKGEEIMSGIRSGLYEGIIPSTVVYEFILHWLRGKIPSLKSIDEAKTFLFTYFKVNELTSNDFVESAKIKKEGDEILKMNERRLSIVDSTIIHLARKLGVGIITGDKDLTLVARKLGVEIIW